MIIVLKREATPETAQELLDRIAEKGLKPLHMPGTERVVLGALGDERVLAELALDSHPMVESLKPILAPYKLVSRELHPHDTIVRIGNAAIGGRGFTVIAGPCAVETEDQMRNTARAAKAAGAHGLRAGAYKPRTSPYAFQGHDPVVCIGKRALKPGRYNPCSGNQVFTAAIVPQPLPQLKNRLFRSFCQVMDGWKSAYKFPVVGHSLLYTGLL